MPFRRLALCLLALALFASPASAKEAPRKLVLEDFFRGRFVANGTFNNTRDGSKRGLKVAMKGTWNGKALTLVEDFVYSDGERDKKTWVFTKIAEGRYTGRREDVLGEAEIYNDGNDVRLKYVATVRSGGAGYDVRFNDKLSVVDRRTVLNTADVSYFLFPVGNVELTIKKVGK